MPHPKRPGAGPLAGFSGGLLLLIACTALAFDPSAVDILTLRLGMTELQVIERLNAQGYVDPQLRRIDRPCPGHAAARCLAEIVARTRDGWLAIGFVGRTAGTEVVDRIAYTFDARRPGEPDAIEASVLNRYGPPTIRQPMTWCDRLAAADRCSPNVARLSFGPGIAPARVLTLTAPAVAER
jgi:hypothetical protein